MGAVFSSGTFDRNQGRLRIDSNAVAPAQVSFGVTVFYGVL